MQNKRPKIIVFTGPESTAKSTLSKHISEEYGARWEPEYARDYVEGLNRSYTYDDVVKIAKYQIESYWKACELNQSLIVFDTFLIITKVWLSEVYHRVPEWVEHFLSEVKIDLHLLCYPDLEWVADGIRENEAKRMYLFEQYELELKMYNFTYQIIKGQGHERYQQAINHINQIL
ncbi:ATP-binding protein [Carboxylicivirga sp. A043]|uniref:ATP-binding protein n=1 Tax=Carboxylicivirga litoralis TaxID=2816963 RepID=UPI0021CB35F2|nr:ATP-binding protein [Carboxylicivirga sp. A043]MCU4157361.1 ATP-binding protein [Carboxylicivirga sp. A043]